MRYRNYHIEHDPKPVGSHHYDWSWWHDDYDGAPDSRDIRIGYAASPEAAMVEIDELENYLSSSQG